MEGGLTLQPRYFRPSKELLIISAEQVERHSKFPVDNKIQQYIPKQMVFRSVTAQMVFRVVIVVTILKTICGI